jgi:circadian clock protein KaiC
VLDSLGQRLLSEVRANNTRRLFVDGLGGFRQAAPNALRLARFYAALSNELRALGVTTVYSQETRNLIGAPPEPPLSGISEVAENVVLLRIVEQRSQLNRFVSVLKVLDSEFDSALHVYRIGKGGIEIEAGPERTEEILSGAPLAQRRSPRKRRSR